MSQRVQLDFSSKGIEDLERLKRLGETSTTAATIRAALAVYDWFLSATEEQGKEVLVKDPKSGEVEKIKLLRTG